MLGYDKDEDGNLVINEDEAETVKVIYYLYLNGFSISEIADLLTEYGRKTKLGNTEWNPGSIMKIIQNERALVERLMKLHPEYEKEIREIIESVDRLMSENK